MIDLLPMIAHKILAGAGVYGPLVLLQQLIIFSLWRDYKRLVDIRHKEAQEARQELLGILSSLPTEIRQILEENLRRTVSIYKLIMGKENKQSSKDSNNVS